MANEFISAVLLLLIVFDPFGNLPLVNGVLSGTAPERRRPVVLRECAIAFVLLLLFMGFGQSFLALLRLSETSLSIAGGIILFMIAIRMVFGNVEGTFGAKADREPFIVPVAVPFIAGPSALATVMLLASRDPSRMGMWAGAIATAMAITTVVLALGEWLQQRMGERAMIAVERLMGLILTAIAIEMLLGGIRVFVKGLSG